MSKFKILVLFALIFGGWQTWSERVEKHPAGIIAANEPEQTPLDLTTTTFNNYRLTLHAHFVVDARVLARERYRFDRLADLIPVNFALGWGRMSDSAVLEKIDITQSGRFYFWSTSDAPIPLQEIETHSANMHMIPADSFVRGRLLSVRVGQVVHIEGELVDAAAPDGWRINTSLTRNDTGAGACEVIFVHDVSITQ